MSDNTTTPGRFARRRAARRPETVARRSVVEQLRAWREERRLAAAKARTKARKAEQKASAGLRGVDRVPAHLRGLHASPGRHEASPIRLNDDGTVRRGGHPIVTTVTAGGNHDERRARGQRGHYRRPRRRELRVAFAANRSRDSALAVQRAETRAARDQARGRTS